jgi:hypothetical protein
MSGYAALTRPTRLHTRNAFQKLPVVNQAGVLIDMLANAFFQPRLLFLKLGQHRLYRYQDHLGDLSDLHLLQTVGFALAILLDRLIAGQ